MIRHSGVSPLKSLHKPKARIMKKEAESRSYVPPFVEELQIAVEQGFTTSGNVKGFEEEEW
jgi:hypothetical protein